jgi:glyoxylase-like metal-dependent hydrolase (beta-lactamase superfamily II)
MKIHHLNCATLCPPLAKMAINRAGRLVCHCLLIETERGLTLVDTGIGTHDIDDPAARLGRPFVGVVRPTLNRNECAVRQIEALGFKASDVRHIVVTHLDLDHAGGLSDFPDAEVHVYQTEIDGALQRATANERGRYRPQQWAHGPRWVVHRLQGDRWNGFESVRALDERQPEVLLVPVEGHTRGHCAVAVSTERGWLLHCGDAYFFKREMDAVNPRCSPGLAFFQRLVAFDDNQRRANQERLRTLAREKSDVRVFSAHDPDELQAMIEGAAHGARSAA